MFTALSCLIATCCTTWPGKLRCHVSVQDDFIERLGEAVKVAFASATAGPLFRGLKKRVLAEVQARKIP
jgi:hypothetical protein